MLSFMVTDAVYSTGCEFVADGGRAPAGRRVSASYLER